MVLKNCFYTVLFAVCILAGAASAVADTFLTATTDTEGSAVVQLRSSADGSILLSDTLPTSAQGGFLLHGNWQQNAYGLIQLNVQTATFELRSFSGSSICSFELGKDVVRVQAVDVDSSGVDDILVQTAGADTASVFSSCGTLLRSVAITEDTNVFYAATSSGLQTGFVQYPKKKKDGDPSVHLSGQSFPLSSGVDKVLPATSGSSFTALIKRKRSLLSFDGANERDLSQSVRKNDSIFEVLGDDADTFAVGTKKGSVSIFNRNGDLLRSLSLTVDGKRAKRIKDPSPYPAGACKGYHNLVAQGFKGLNGGSFLSFFRVAFQLRNTSVPKRCFLRADNPLDPSVINIKRPLINYGSSLLRLSSNSGDQKGPCSKFFKAEDGPGGFLVKNSDHVGLVYLTPRQYFNGRQLDKNTFKLKTGTQYTGLANGLRAHHRITTQNLPRPAHVFAADISPTETHCWRIPGGKTRID